MTSASVTLHESNFSVHADTLVLHWMWAHHGKAMRHRKPDEWRITCARAKAGGLCATATEAGHALPAMPTALPGRRQHLRQHSPRSFAPSHLGRQTVGRREIARSRWGHLLWLAYPSIVSLSHVTYSCFLVWQHFKTGLFSFGWDTKGKGVRKSWQGLSLLRLKFSERADTKRRTSLRANKSGAPPAPQKAVMHPYSSPRHSPYKIPWAPRRR